MKKTIKKLLTTLCAMVLSVVLLSGCSWLKIDQKEYYNQVVATVGTKNFYKKDLIEAFSNYGYQYYQQGTMSLEDSVKQTINTMIDRELLLDEVKSIFGDLSDPEEKELRKQAYDYMQDSIFTYESQIRKEWDMEIKVEDEGTDAHSHLRAEKTTYTPTTEYVDGQVQRIEEQKEKIFTEGLTEHFTKANQIVTDEKVSNAAWARYVKALQDGAKSEGRSTIEKDVLLHEEERLITLLTNNYYLEKYEDAFFDRTAVDTDSVIAYYKEQYKKQKNLYSVDINAYHTAMKDASKNYIYYHPQNDNNNYKHEYVNVKHILIKFSDEQTAEITSLNTEYGVKEKSEMKDTNPKYTEYMNRYNAITSKTRTTFEIDHETYSDWSVNQVYNYVKSYVTGTNKDKSKKFDELIYVFNDDEGFMNSEFDYVVNLDTTVTDQMVKPFADGARSLDEAYGGEGFGSMCMVETTYGYHIIFHDGNAKSLVAENDIDNIHDEELLELLCTTMTRPDSNKSIFNYIYDKLSLDQGLYDNMTQEAVNTIKSNLKKDGVKIVYYQNNYKDLYEG